MRTLPSSISAAPFRTGPRAGEREIEPRVLLEVDDAAGLDRERRALAHADETVDDVPALRRPRLVLLDRALVHDDLAVGGASR